MTKSTQSGNKDKTRSKKRPGSKRALEQMENEGMKFTHANRQGPKPKYELLKEAKPLDPTGKHTKWKEDHMRDVKLLRESGESGRCSPQVQEMANVLYWPTVAAK